MGIFDIFRKQKNKNNLSDTFHELDEPTDRLIDGELPHMWYYENAYLVKSKESEITNLASQYKHSKLIDEKIPILNKIIKAFYLYQDYCYSKNECFTKYFDDMWMHCHNSKCENFCYITRYEEELKRLKDNYADLKEKEIYLRSVDDKLIQIIFCYPDGIPQVDVMKEFPTEFSNEIREMIYQLIKNKKIRKEKNGRYNILFPLN